MLDNNSKSFWLIKIVSASFDSKNNRKSDEINAFLKNECSVGCANLFTIHAHSHACIHDNVPWKLFCQWSDVTIYFRHGYVIWYTEFLA